jgi:hypothetical protein
MRTQVSRIQYILYYIYLPRLTGSQCVLNRVIGIARDGTMPMSPMWRVLGFPYTCSQRLGQPCGQYRIDNPSRKILTIRKASFPLKRISESRSSGSSPDEKTWCALHITQSGSVDGAHWHVATKRQARHCAVRCIRIFRCSKLHATETQTLPIQ